MKFLTALFLLLCVSAFGAVPAYTSFRGTGGILITSNPPTGNITIDGSGVFTTSGTNASVAISTNGVLVMAAATNVNFVHGTNVVLTVTNLASTAHVGIHTVTPPADKSISIKVNGTTISLGATQFNAVEGINTVLAPGTNSPAGNVSIGFNLRDNLRFFAGVNEMVLGTWGNVFALSNVQTGDLSFYNSDPGAGDDWVFGGLISADNANFSAMPGTGSNVIITTGGTLYRTNIVSTIEGAVTNLLLTWILPILVVDNLTVTNLGSAPPISSIQFNSNGVTRGSPLLTFTNGLVTVANTTKSSNVWDIGNVRYWGALEGTVIDNALTNALAHSRNVYIPAGQYYLASSITVPDSTRIYGDGPDATRLMNCGATNLTTFVMGFKTALSGLCLDGTCGVGSTDTGVRITAGETKVTECYFLNLTTNILILNGYAEIRSCRFATVLTNKHAVVVGGPTGGSGNRITDNRFEVGPGSGILYSWPANGDLVSGNVFEGGTGLGCRGITIPTNSSQLGLTIMGNYWEDVAIPLSVGVGGGAKPVGSLNLIGNEFAVSGAVHITSLSNLVAIGNNFGGGWGLGTVDNLVNIQNTSPAFTNGSSHYVHVAAGKVIAADNIGVATESPTNRLDVNGHASIRSNLFLANLPTNGSPIAFLAVDAAGAVYETALETGGGGTLSISVNGTSVSLLATQVNFVQGLGIELLSTNSPSGLVSLGIANKHSSVLSNFVLAGGIALPAPPFSSVQFNSNGVMKGSADFIFTNGNVYAANIIVAGQGLEVTTGSLILNGGITALAAWNGLGHIRWDADGVMRVENDSGLSFNRINLGPNGEGSPALGATNGDAIFFGANGAFGPGATNRLLVPGGVVVTSSSAYGTPQIQMGYAPGGEFWDFVAGAHPETYFLGLKQGSTYAMVWELGGNVGVGTTNPTTRFDVQGRTTLRSNVFLPNIASNATPIAFLATDAAGEVFETAVPAVAASAETNAVLTNIIGTVARNVTNVVSLSTTNATSKPLTNAYANGVLTLFGVEAGANVTITPNGSNLVIAATGGSSSPSLPMASVQFHRTGGIFGGTNLFVYDETNNRVGIGTATPTATLDVNSSVEPQIAVTGAGGASAYLLGQGDGYVITGYRKGATLSGNGWNIGMDGGSANFSFVSRLSSVNTARLTIDQGTGNVGIGTATPTNQLHVHGDAGIHGTNVFLPNLPTNSAPVNIAFLATDAGGKVYKTAAPAGGDAHAWASNSIPFMNPAGNALVFYNPGNILSNGGFGFHPIGPHGGGAYGGLRVFAPYSSGLLTIGHPNPGSSFATFVTALSVSNAYDGTGFKQEMSKYDATDTGSGSDPSSTFVTYRTWSGSTPTIAAEVRKDGMGFFSHGTMYQSNALAVAAMPTAAELGPGGYWAGVSNTSFVVMHSADGTATSMKVLSP